MSQKIPISTGEAVCNVEREWSYSPSPEIAYELAEIIVESRDKSALPRGKQRTALLKKASEIAKDSTIRGSKIIHEAKPLIQLILDEASARDAIGSFAQAKVLQNAAQSLSDALGVVDEPLKIQEELTELGIGKRGAPRSACRDVCTALIARSLHLYLRATGRRPRTSKHQRGDQSYSSKFLRGYLELQRAFPVELRLPETVVRSRAAELLGNRANKPPK